MMILKMMKNYYFLNPNQGPLTMESWSGRSEEGRRKSKIQYLEDLGGWSGVIFFGAILSIKYGQEKFELKILRFRLKVFGETIDWQIWVSVTSSSSSSRHHIITSSSSSSSSSSSPSSLSSSSSSHHIIIISSSSSSRHIILWVIAMTAPLIRIRSSSHDFNFTIKML